MYQAKIKTGGYISSRAVISSRALVAPSAKVYGPVVIDDYVFIDSDVIVGYPSPKEQALLMAKIRAAESCESLSFDAFIDAQVSARTLIKEQAVIRSGTIIYSGSVLSEGVDVAHNVHIREACTVGRDTRIITGAQIMAEVTIGCGCRIAGTLCNRSGVGDCTSMLGHLMHRYKVGVSGHIEASPRVGSGVVVGRESAIVGGVDIGDFSIVGAGAVVTTSVPAQSIWARNPAVQVGTRSEADVDELRRKLKSYESQ